MLNVSIYGDGNVSGPPDLLKDILILTFAPLYKRSKQHDTRPAGQIEDGVDNLLDSLLAYLAPAIRTMRMTDTSIQQPQIIINLCHCRYCRPWAMCRTFLVAHDSRREP